MSLKPVRVRKSRQKDEMKSEIVPQVHRTGNNKPRDLSLDGNVDIGSEESSGSNRTYVREDIKNDNCSIQNTPSREISVDGETQINSKIISLIEAEIKREVKHSTFSDSRPQSLSFYEEEKMPEELSGNLELLSPEEKKHYKRRKDYAQMDTEERNMYNSIQDIYNRDNDDIMSNSLKKSKSKKKKHSGDGELGMGDSREMMIPKEKRKSKKKKHENSPMSSGKRKHKKRVNEQDEYERSDITMALDDLQDDVFEHNLDDYASNSGGGGGGGNGGAGGGVGGLGSTGPISNLNPNGTRHEKIRKSPRKTDKLYVQKKNKFELSSREAGGVIEAHPIRQQYVKVPTYPLHYAITAQKCWRKFTNFCHGLLGGLGFAHFIYITTNEFSTDPESLKNYASYSEAYVILFYLLSVLCLISVFDKYDVGHLSCINLKELIRNRKSCFVILLYAVTLILHLITGPKDDQISMVAEDYKYVFNITTEDLRLWNSLSFTRGFFAFISWFFVSLTSQEDYLLMHLNSMESYAIPNGGA